MNVYWVPIIHTMARIHTQLGAFSPAVGVNPMAAFEEAS